MTYTAEQIEAALAKAQELIERPQRDHGYNRRDLVGIIEQLRAALESAEKNHMLLHASITEYSARTDAEIAQLRADKEALCQAFRLLGVKIESDANLFPLKSYIPEVENDHA